MLSSLPGCFGWRTSGRRNLCNRRQDALKLQPSWRIGSNHALQSILSVPEKSPIGSRCDGQRKVEVVQEESASSIGEPQFAALKRLRVGPSKNWQQYAILQRAARRVPIDIKVRRERRSRTIFQQIHPPGILARGCHMVWHDVEQ